MGETGEEPGGGEGRRESFFGCAETYAATIVPTAPMIATTIVAFVGVSSTLSSLGGAVEYLDSVSLSVTLPLR